MSEQLDYQYYQALVDRGFVSAEQGPVKSGSSICSYATVDTALNPRRVVPASAGTSGEANVGRAGRNPRATSRRKQDSATESDSSCGGPCCLFLMSLQFLLHTFEVGTCIALTGLREMSFAFPPTSSVAPDVACQHHCVHRLDPQISLACVCDDGASS